MDTEEHFLKVVRIYALLLTLIFYFYLFDYLTCIFPKRIWDDSYKYIQLNKQIYC